MVGRIYFGKRYGVEKGLIRFNRNRRTKAPIQIEQELFYDVEKQKELPN